jgi:hypothetical protein
LHTAQRTGGEDRLLPDGFRGDCWALGRPAAGAPERPVSRVYPYVQVGHLFAGREAIEASSQLDKLPATEK